MADDNKQEQKQNNSIDKAVRAIERQENKSVSALEKKERAAVKNVSRQEESSTLTISKQRDASIKSVQIAGKESNKNIEKISKLFLREIGVATKKSIAGVKSQEKQSAKAAKQVFSELQKKTSNTIKEIVREQKNKAFAEITKKQSDFFRLVVDGSPIPQPTNVTDTPEINDTEDKSTKILSDILNELKLIRKSASSKEDGQQQKEEKRKGFFASVKDRFVKTKKEVGAALSQAGDAAKQAKSNLTDLATNPVVLAGILALIAPKEVLSFIKGFLGDIIFGEEKNEFVEGLTVFLGVLAGFKLAAAISKLYKLYKNIISFAHSIYKAISSVVRLIWDIGKFLFKNPAILVVVALAASIAQLIGDFREKYGKRMERKALEEDIETLKTQLKDPNTTSEQKKQIEEQIKQKEVRLEELKKENIFSTQRQAIDAATKGFKLKDTEQKAVDTAVDFKIAEGKINQKQPLSKDEQGLYDAYKTEKDPIAAIAKDFGTTVEVIRPAIDEKLQQKLGKPTPEQKPATASTPAPTPSTPPAPSATPSTPPAPPAMSGAQEMPTATATSAESPQPAPLQPATLQPTARSSNVGEQINKASTAVDSAYDTKPEQSTFTASNTNEHIAAKKANVISAIPGIIADRSDVIEYETFYTSSAFAV